jgi:ABC-2 type transport system permease protein
LGVVLEDTGPEARRLAGAFEATPYFDARGSFDRREAIPELVSSRLRGLVVIPQDFARALHTPGGMARIQVIADGSETNTANFVANYAQGTVAAWASQEAALAGRTVQAQATMRPRFFYNAELNSRYSLVPGSLAVIMAIIGSLLTALVVAREWERGTMEAILATPLSAPEIVLGKLVPYFILGMASMAVCTAVAFFLFGIPFRGSLPALAVASAAFLLAALGQGFLISTVSRNQFLASQAALVSAFLPAFILSGFVFEIASMPLIIRTLTRIIPARYFVTSLQTVFLTGDVWSLLVPNALVCLAIAGAFFALTLKKTPRRLE